MQLPWTISNIWALDKFCSRLVRTSFVANGQMIKKYTYGWITSCPKLPPLKALARYKYILMGSEWALNYMCLVSHWSTITFFFNLPSYKAIVANIGSTSNSSLKLENKRKLMCCEVFYHNANITLPPDKITHLSWRHFTKILCPKCSWGIVAGTLFSIPSSWKIDHDHEQGPVIQKVDNVIHQINLYPVHDVIGFPNTYPMDSAIQCLNNWGQGCCYVILKTFSNCQYIQLLLVMTSAQNWPKTAISIMT